MDSGHHRSQSFGIIGVGEVGLRLSIVLSNSGFDVVGVDLDADRVADLNRGVSYIRDIPDEQVQQLRDSGFQPTTTYSDLEAVDYVSICVPTPLRKSGTPDVSYVVDAIEQLTDVVSPGTTIIIESTVYPGATETVFAEILEEAGFTIGEDIYLAFSPERVDPGNEEYDITEIPKVVGGVTDSSTDRVVGVYERVFEELVLVDSTTEAEMTKILENTFRNINIALVNELVKVADNFGIDFWNVIDAAETKPYGFMPFYPGPGLGGHCIPVDPVYLSWKAKQEGVDTPLIDLADRTNREMSEYIVHRLTHSLNKRGVPVPEADILLLGAAYKADVPDVRNAPAKDLIILLEERDANVNYADPHVPELTIGGETLEAVSPTPETIESQDAVVLVTAHSTFDFDRIADHAQFVFDTRNAMADYDTDEIETL